MFVLLDLNGCLILYSGQRKVCSRVCEISVGG